MATVVVTKSGGSYEVEEDLAAVETLMTMPVISPSSLEDKRRNGIGHFHIANGSAGWQPAGERGPLILIRGDEIAVAYSIPTKDNPMRPVAFET